MLKIICSVATILLLGSCTSGVKDSNGESARISLSEARKGFKTKIIKEAGVKGAVPEPPQELFRVVAYPAAIGNMPAYLSTIPQDGKLHPAMVWVTGGFGNDIGDVWSPQEADNDQSASVIREAGVVMMYPAQRGGNTSPGTDESGYGEIDDIVAAAKFLATQPGVDPKRIYLGGHSTGGTKVILAAECSNLFRAVFSFGPVAEIALYGDEALTFDLHDEKEMELRAPVRWLSSLSCPLFVFEGTGEGNYDQLKILESSAKDEDNKQASFYPVQGKSHFSVIQPVSRLIARKILSDTGSSCNIRFNMDELTVR